MTKSAELTILDDTIKRLGVNSYLGPWLFNLKPVLESELRSDFAPSDHQTPAQARLEAQAIVLDAQDRAREIVNEARSKAQTIIREATEKAVEADRVTRRQLHDDLQAIIRRL